MDDSHMMWSNVGLYIDHEDLICSLSIFSYIGALMNALSFLHLYYYYDVLTKPPSFERKAQSLIQSKHFSIIINSCMATRNHQLPF